MKYGMRVIDAECKGGPISEFLTEWGIVNGTDKPVMITITNGENTMVGGYTIQPNSRLAFDEQPINAMKFDGIEKWRLEVVQPEPVVDTVVIRRAIEIMRAAQDWMERTANGEHDERGYMRVIDAIEAFKPGPTYHELRLAEWCQHNAREFAGMAQMYREAIMTMRAFTTGRALNCTMCNAYADKAADMARRARVLMGVDE